MYDRLRWGMAASAVAALQWACSSTPGAAPIDGGTDSNAPGVASDAGDDGGPAGIDAGSPAVDASADAGGGADAASGQGPTLASLSVSTGALVPAFDPGVTEYHVTSLNGLYPIEVTATANDPSAKLTVHGAAAQGGTPSSFTLQPREDFTVVVTSTAGASTTYTVHYVPSDMPSYTVSNAPGAGTEDVMLTPGSAYLLLVDRSGAPLYYRTFPSQMVSDFKQHQLPGGEVVYSASVAPTTSIGWAEGVQHLMDRQFHDLGDIQAVPNRAHGALPVDLHDFRWLGDDHYIVDAYVQRTVDLSGANPAWSANAQVINCVVQEIDHGSVVLEWDSGDFPSLYADSVDHNDFTSSTVAQDYLHLNSIDVDPADGDLILSLRHTNSIVKVDRETGQIVWTLGGAEDQFGLTADEVFSHQHYVRVQPDGSLWVFDNGNNLHQSRVISFVLDEASRKVTSFQVVYGKPASEPQTSFMGSYTQLPGGRLMIGWGGWSTQDIEPAVTEIAGGATVWSLTLTTPGQFSYRATTITTL